MQEILQLHAVLQHRLTIKHGSLLAAGATEYESAWSLPLEATSLGHQNFSEDSRPSCTISSCNFVFLIHNTEHPWVCKHGHSSLLLISEGPPHLKSKLQLLGFPLFSKFSLSRACLVVLRQGKCLESLMLQVPSSSVSQEFSLLLDAFHKRSNQ